MSWARDFEFNNVSDLRARISFLIKSASMQNTKNVEREDRENAYKINNSVLFAPKTDDPLDVVIDILGDDIEHKKTTHPYVLPQVQTAPTIELETQAIDNEFAKLKEQFDRVGNVAAEHKKQKQTVELVYDIIEDKILLQNVEIDDIWIDDDLFDSNDLQAIVETSKQIIDEITPNPLIELNIATLPDTEDKMDDDDIDFTIADSQLVEGNNTQLNRDTKPFVDFTVTYSRVVDSDSDNNIDFTITDSQLVEGNGTGVNRENQLFVDFTITDSRVVGNSNNDSDSEIDFTITSSEFVEGNDPTVNNETEPFIDFTITDSRAIDSEDGVEYTLPWMMILRYQIQVS